MTDAAKTLTDRPVALAATATAEKQPEKTATKSEAKKPAPKKAKPAKAKKPAPKKAKPAKAKKPTPKKAKLSKGLRNLKRAAKKYNAAKKATKRANQSAIDLDKLKRLIKGKGKTVPQLMKELRQPRINVARALVRLGKVVKVKSKQVEPKGLPGARPFVYSVGS